MKNLSREKSNIIKSGDSANLNIFNQMPYTFTRTDDYVIIEHSDNQYYAVTRGQANVTGQTTNISITGGFSLNFPYSDIGTINGATPSSLQDAVLKLGLLFKGYSPIKITIE